MKAYRSIFLILAIFLFSCSKEKRVINDLRKCFYKDGGKWNVVKKRTEYFYPATNGTLIRSEEQTNIGQYVFTNLGSANTSGNEGTYAIPGREPEDLIYRVKLNKDFSEDEFQLETVFDQRSTYRSDTYTISDNYSENEIVLINTDYIADTAKISTYFLASE